MSDTETSLQHPDPSEFEEHGHQRSLINWAARIAIFGALCFSAYQISVAAFHPFSSLIIRALHVSFLLLLIFMLYPATAKGRTQKTIPWYDMILSLLGFSVGFYHLFFEGELIDAATNKPVMKVVRKGEGKELNNENTPMTFATLKQVVDDMATDATMFDVKKTAK